METSTHIEPGAEKREPNVRAIWMYIVITLLFVGTVHITGYFWFLGLKDAELHAKEAGTRDRALQNLQAKEAEALNQYKWVDKEKGKVQIPVSRAMELMAGEQASPPTASQDSAKAVKDSVQAAAHPEAKK